MHNNQTSHLIRTLIFSRAQTVDFWQGGRGKWKAIFSLYYYSQRFSFTFIGLLWIFEPVICGDFSLIHKTPRNVSTRLILSVVVLEILLGPVPSAMLFPHCSASYFLEVSCCPLSSLTLDLRLVTLCWQLMSGFQAADLFYVWPTT